MLNRLLTGIFGSRNDRFVKQLGAIVKKINALEPQMEALSDAELQAKTPALKQRVANGESLDRVLPEAFAVCREASKRVLGMRHYDVQLIGGMVLHLGKIAEMRTGEGKTLVGTLPVYLNALEGKGVHVVTVNDYLARRDSAWMGKLYNWLGLSVGVVYPGMNHGDKAAAYGSDITYGTNNEFGFDYLRDNMALSKEDRHQRGLHYAIVDEVDSILIDEARTPLIISGPADESPELYVKVNRIVPQLKRQEVEDGVGDYWIDEKSKQVHLSEAGQEHAEDLLRRAGIIDTDDGLYAAHNIHVVHHMNAAMRAHTLFQRDVDYIVRDGEVVIVDEFTGRTLTGRRWSDGLHQAVEAKEGVPVQRENQTLASITFQNLFRMYGKLSGMTGTADTEAYEFQNIYSLEVVVIPTHRPMVRKDHPDAVFLNKAGKYRAVSAEIKEANGRGQPVLVGTTSIEVSEMLSEQLKTDGIVHEVLNAKQHEREAHIIAQAGRPHAVTIATNMAGRGTDIKLGGDSESIIGESIEGQLGISRFTPEAENFIKAISREDPQAAHLGTLIPGITPEFIAQAQQLHADVKADHEHVKALGGLHIVGTERHESRRIDNQLRGRAGRQGDPGSSRFYVSFEDDLMRLFANERVVAMMDRLGMDDTQPIEAKMVTGAIEKAQARVEDRNFSTRKQLLEFDNVMSKQRDTVYAQRREVLLGPDDDVEESTEGMIADFVDMQLATYVPMDQNADAWDIEGLQTSVLDAVPQLDGFDFEALRSRTPAEVQNALLQAVADAYDARRDELGPTMLNSLARYVLLQVVDQHWKEHLHGMDVLRQGIGLRGYGQRDPFTEYKFEATNMFNEMIDTLKGEVTKFVFRMQFGQSA